MEPSKENFKAMLAFGQEGEHEVGVVLLQRGVTFLPLYQFTSDSAPVVFFGQKSTVSPDFICFKRDCFFVEVKTKNQWVKWNNTVETGLDKRLFEHYKQIQNITNKKVWLCFNHKQQEPLGVFCCSLDSYTRVWDGCNNGKAKYKPMVFYEFRVLTKLA